MKNLSWMIKGGILGLSFFISLLLIKPIGVSTQFSVLSGMIHSTIDSDVITENESRKSGYESTNAYYDKSEGSLAKSIKKPLNYDFIFVLAIPLGAIIGNLFLRKKTVKMPVTFSETAKTQVTREKNYFLKTYGPPFVSGFLLLFGARMADGCTSGHMMSGMMQGSVSGFFFAASVFIVAIPLSIYLNKNKEVTS